MAKYQVRYTTLDGDVKLATYNVPDAGCAIGILLDESTDLDDSLPIVVAPFGKLHLATPAPQPLTAPRKAAKKARKPKAKRQAPKPAPAASPADKAKRFAKRRPWTGREDATGLLSFLEANVKGSHK